MVITNGLWMAAEVFSVHAAWPVMHGLHYTSLEVDR